MNATTVRVGRVEMREGTKNGRDWKRWDFYDANGDRYSTFDGALGSLLAGSGGAMLDIEFERGERGRNLQSAKPHVEEQPAAAPRVRATATAVDHRDRLIVREVALKAAAEYCGTVPCSTPGAVLSVAEAFVAWLLKDE